MPVSCPRCATANPDQNAFCQSCGGPLAGAASAPASPPPAAADAGTSIGAVPASSAGGSPPGSPVIPSTYYATPGQSPYYTPPPAASGGGPVHRLSRTALFAIIGAALLVLAGVGAIVAFAGHGPPKPVPPAPTATAQPAAPPAGGPTASPFSPSPSTAPRPTAAPPAPQPSGVVTTSFATVPVPAGFTSQSPQGTTLELDPTSGPGQVFVNEGQLNPSLHTNQDLSDDILRQATSSSPDAHRCQPDTAQQLSTKGGAVPAVFLTICETYTPQNGQAFQAVDAYQAAVTRAADGTPEWIAVELFAPADQYNNFEATVPNSFYTGVVFNTAGAP